MIRGLSGRLSEVSKRAEASSERDHLTQDVFEDR